MHYCKNCNSNFTGNYCNNCGQKLFSSNDKSMKSLLEELIHFLTHFEGTFFTTLKNIFFYPSKLSNDYCSGIRKRNFKPFSLFLLVVILYLLVPMASGLNMKMKYYKTSFIGKNLITTQIEKKVNQLNISENDLAIKFENKSEKVAKFLLFALIPLTSLVLYILFYKKRTLLYDTIIISTEFNIFFISFYFLLLPALIFPFSFFFQSLKEIDNNLFLVVLFIITFILYTTVLFYKFYNQSKVVSFAKSLVFAFAYNIIILSIYRFLVFEFVIMLL